MYDVPIELGTHEAGADLNGKYKHHRRDWKKFE